ncbi:MAG: type II secretion system protein [Nitrospirae bacterium]|nr:type II secretion system protein [Nitrospirota bacterium]
MHKKNNNKGITLLEIVISLLIFGIAATGILRSFVFCNTRAKSTSLRTAAIALAQERMEQIKNDSYPNVTAANYPDETNLILDTAGTADTGDDLTGTRTVTITGASPNPKTITVTVTWKFKGNQFSESLTTLKIP